MTITKKLSLLVLVSTFFFVTSGVTGMLFNLRNQKQLHDYMNHMVTKQNLLLEVYRSLGYGKGIHAFMDYILSHDPVDEARAREGLLEAKSLVHEYQNFFDLSEIEKSSLNTISNTIDTYIKNLNVAKELFIQGKTSREVNELLRVNDAAATLAIDEIQTYFSDKKRNIETEIITTQERTFFLMLTSFLIIFFVRRLVGKHIISGIKESIHRLISMADQIAIENRKVEKPKLAHDEIGELGDHLFDMSLKLETNYRDINRSKQELEDLALITSQDLQEQLTKIDIGLDVLQLKEQNRLSDVGKQYINDIKNYVLKMQEITLSFIDYAKVGNEELATSIVDLNKVVEKVIQELNFGKHNLPIIFNKDKLPKVRGEQKLLVMLFHNLLANAIKYHHKFSELIIDIHCQEVGRNKVRINVADNGTGFNLKYIQTAFSPYEKLYDKLKLPGGGIGLSICRKVLTIHNSNFEINSESQKGTKISFDLELAA